MIRSLPLAVLKRILENKLHAKLNVAREVALHAAGEAEARVARVEIEVNDIRVIERVERLAPELNALALADLEILRYREIDRLVRHVPQIVVCRFEVAQAKRVQPDEPGRVEDRQVRAAGRALEDAILVAAAVALERMRLELRRITRVVDVLGEVERLARLPLVRTVELPAADYGVNQAVHILAKEASAPDRQPIAGRQRKAVGTVVRREAVLKLRIGRVQVAELLAQVRACIRNVE